MSEVDSRPASSRGRSSTRGGRGGFGRAGARGAYRPSNGAATDAPPVDESIEEQGELGDLKKQYSSELGLLKDMFPDWSDVDLVMALQETDGDLPVTIERITEGHVSQFSEITKKPKDRARSKAKDLLTTTGADQGALAGRGGRGRGGFDTRGGRGRGADRGRGASRTARGASTAPNGFSSDSGALAAPATDSAAWDTQAAATGATTSSWDTPPTAPTSQADEKGGFLAGLTSTPATASEGAKSSLISESGAKKSWASMFAQTPKSMAAPAAPKSAGVPPPLPAAPASGDLAIGHEAATADAQQIELLPSLPAMDQTPLPEPPSAEEPFEADADVVEAATQFAQVPLTEDNLEHLPDSSNPPATLTVVSTVGSVDPRGATPIGLSQQAPIGRPPMGGYAASAYRAAGTPARSASFQRRVLEQQEAVVMPGHNVVDRAAVQFGSMGLNGDSDGLDVDDAREEAETRTQPPQQSPAQPRASLPPAGRQIQTLAQDPYAAESLSTPKQAPGLPPAPQHHSLQDSLPGLSQDPLQSSQSYNQYGRYGDSGMQSEAAAPSQKSYDPFSHQTPATAFDHYSSQSQQPSSHQQQGFGGGYSSAPSDYSQYYTSDAQRNAYQNYYGGSYGQQGSHSQQDAGSGQQRATSGFGSGPNESAYSSGQGPQQVGTTIPLVSALMQRDLQQKRASMTPGKSGLPALEGNSVRGKIKQENTPLSSHRPNYFYANSSDSSEQSQPRYNDATGSGNNTPNPMGGQQQSVAPPQQQQQQPQHSQYNSSFPYGHPYYNSPYHTAYQNQFVGYGAQYAGKGGMYGQPQGYPPSSYEQPSQPGSASGFNQQPSLQSRESGLGGGLSDYGRTPANAPPQQHGLGGSGLGGMSEPFGRSQSGFPGQGQSQSQGYGQHSMQQPGPADDLKPFGDSKPTGPSPAMGQPGRPGSAANSMGSQTQSSLPPPQSHQQGFGGYPGFNQGSQYGGLGSAGGHQGQGQSHQQGAYGGGYGGGFASTYGQYGRGAGWGGNYSGH